LIELVSQTGSTNADLVSRLTEGEPLAEGLWRIADRQTDGRGRLGREWQDGAGNFMGSTIVRLLSGDPPAASLALLAGVTLHDLLAPRANTPLTLKWPNDLLAGSAKLAGILLQRVGDAVVVGIGVNLAVAPSVPDRPAAALADLEATIARDDFAQALSRGFSADLERWRIFGLEPLVARWTSVGHPPGTPLVVDEGEGKLLHGSFAGLAPDGALQLRLADGALRVIHAGETRIA
jgi:BirA family biotin operon repressor/biotin-[acetyl-CoA-carboxylase] ligase